MALSTDELAIWSALSDDPPPDEAPGRGPLRVFVVPREDSRFPATLPMPALAASAPPRLRRHWVSSLIAELTGSCPCCPARRPDANPTLVHARRCELRGFGERARKHLADPRLADQLAPFDPRGILARMPT